MLGTIDLEASTVEAKVYGEAAGDALSYRAITTGDVNADGRDDLILGAHGNDRGGSGAGACWYRSGPVSGAVSAAAADVVLTGAAAGD